MIVFSSLSKNDDQDRSLVPKNKPSKKWITQKLSPNQVQLSRSTENLLPFREGRGENAFRVVVGLLRVNNSTDTVRYQTK